MGGFFIFPLPLRERVRVRGILSSVLRPRSTCGWLTHRHLLCALRAQFQKLCAGGSAPAPWVTLLCLSKEESPEEKTPGRFAAHTSRGPLRASLWPGARLTRRAHTTRLGLNQKSRDYSRPGSVLGSLQRGWEQTTSGLRSEVIEVARTYHVGVRDAHPNLPNFGGSLLRASTAARYR